ncbi:MAG: hypothetical protein QMC93_00645 [Patescibacteria group bacterium]|nr:hypothetical protein [Patescibacteria group bacterium]
MALPKFLEPFLPSDDISEMKLHNPYDKKLIIEAVLNQGTMKEIKWLFKIYSLREIKNVLKNPQRGCWDKRILNYWTEIFSIKLHPIVYEMAIIDLNPNPEKWRRWFNFIKKRASQETLKRWKELGLLKTS